MSDEYDVDAMISAQNAAREKDLHQEAAASLDFPKARAVISRDDSGESVSRWLTRLPKNIGVGVIDAAVNTADLIGKVAGKGAEMTGRAEAEAAGIDLNNLPVVDSTQPNMFDEAHKSVLDFRNELASGSKTSDEITQVLAQLVIPFVGWSKLLRVGEAASLAGTIGRSLAAESAAVAHSFGPHSGRIADLLVLGRHTEGKFGELLQTIAPDGSGLNSYINWAASINPDGSQKADEGDFEGYFKNVLDNAGLSVAASGLIAATAKTLKYGRRLLHKAGQPRPPPIADPVAAPPEPTISFEPSMGGDSIVKMSDGSGHLKLRPAGGGFRVTDSFVKEENRVKGRGTKMYEEAIRQAEARGGPLVSDTVVSKDAQRVYDSLEKRGYEVTRNPATPFDDGALQSDNSLRPVYSVRRKPAT